MAAVEIAGLVAATPVSGSISGLSLSELISRSTTARAVFERFPHLAQPLRRAAQRIHALSARFARVPAAGEHFPQIRGGRDLAGMALLLVHPRFERQRGRLRGFHRHRDRRRAGRAARANASACTSAATAVMNVVPLISARASLGAKRRGAIPAAASASSAAMRPALEFGFALAYQNARDVGRGHQVARRAHAAVARHHRGDAAIEQRGKRFDQFDAHAGGAGRNVAMRSSAAARTMSAGSGGPVAQASLPHHVRLQRLHLVGTRARS